MSQRLLYSAWTVLHTRAGRFLRLSDELHSNMTKTTRSPKSLPLRSTVVWKNQHTDVSIWPAHKRATALIIFVSGNPGLVGYYDTFLSTIHAKASLYWEIIGLGHVGQSPDHPPSAAEALKRKNSPLPTLQDQIDSKIDFLDSLRPQFSPDTKVVLIGHSVGAYICQEITKRRPNMISHVYGLFPSLVHIGETPNGKSLRPIFVDSVRVALTAFTYILKILVPFTVVRYLVRLITGQKAPADYTTAQLVTNPGVVSAAVKMGQDEMRNIKELDKDFYRKEGGKVTLYFAAGDSDRWVGDATRVREITTILDHNKDPEDIRPRWYICEKGMQHAFCLEHSNEMAELCATWLLRDLGHEI